MSQGYGPYSVTAGTIQPVGVDPNTAAVFIQNDTPFYLFVSFNPTQPSPSTILNQDWSASIKPFDSQTEYITGPAQLQTPQGAMTFQGKVWLLPVDLRNVSLAQNGTVSSAALVGVRSFLPGEQPPVAYSSSRQTDITSQTRIITLPAVPAISNVINQTVSVGTQTSTTFVAFAPFPLQVYCYLFSLVAQHSPSTSVAWSQWEFGFGEYNNVSAPIANHAVLRFTLSGTTTTLPVTVFSHTPAAPLYSNIQPQPATVQIQPYLRLSASAGGVATAIFATLQADADNVDQQFPTTYGGGLMGETFRLQSGPNAPIF